MAATRLITMHANKGRSVMQCLRDRTEYAKNDEKTEHGEYVSSYACDPKTVEEEFMLSKREYERITGRHPKGDIIAYQIRQSFKPGEITPEEANKVGYETAMRFTKGNHAFIVATHIDKEHIHNHIIYNSTNLSCDRKFWDFFFVGLALQRVSDLVCLEHGLSVIKPRKPSERSRRTTYPERTSFREEIRAALDELLQEKKPKDFDELLHLLEDQGYEIKRGKHAAIKNKNQKRFIRFRSLGRGYSDEDLKKILAGEMEFARADEPKQEGQEKRRGWEKPKREFDLLIDIQKKMAEGKGAGYEHFAKRYNVKQVSKAILFLKNHNVRSYAELQQKADETSAYFNNLSASIKEKEKRLAEIAVLRTHIINYMKTKEVYVSYRRSGYSKKFLEEHRQEILLHQAAKKAFDEQKVKKLSKVKDLNTEYAEVLAEKKKLYSEYHDSKKDMQDYQRAKYDIDKFLEIDREQKEQQKKKSKETYL